MNVVVFSRTSVTFLNGGINAAQTVIPVDTVGSMRSSGTIKIESEDISYTGIDSNSNTITGCVRGGGAAAHADDTEVNIPLDEPAVTRADVTADLSTIDERLAQATIRLKQPINIDMGGAGDTGRAPPAALLDGFTVTSVNPITQFNEDELAVIALRSGSVNTVDIFYVDTITNAGAFAEAYPQVRNQTGNVNGQNFIVASQTRQALTMPHEIMHILLNMAHRADPATALFNGDFDLPDPGKSVHSGKRIGPYPDAATAGVGNNDTTTIRASVDALP